MKDNDAFRFSIISLINVFKPNFDGSIEAFFFKENGPTIVGDVFIHQTARVDPTAVIGPNVSIGKNVKIGAGTRIRYGVP